MRNYCQRIGLAVALFALPASGGANLKHYVYLFSLDNGDQTPTQNHTWATFLEVSTSSKDSPAVTNQLTINWLPVSGIIRTLALGPERGRNFPLTYSFGWALRDHLTLGQWGPYEINDELYRLSVQQKALLDSGDVWYRVVDNPNRIFKLLDPASVPTPRAVMCIHAVSDAVYPVDTRGFLLTGFKSGFAATAQVAWHLAPWYVRDSNSNDEPAPVSSDIKAKMDEALGLSAYPAMKHQRLEPQENLYCHTLDECRQANDGVTFP